MSQKTNNVTKSQPVNKFQKAGQPKKYNPVLPKDFDVKNFEIDKLEVHNERSKVHMIAYPRYKKNTFVFQTPEFVISQYGIAPLGPFAANDGQRTTLKLPLDPKQPECELLKTMFQKMDQHMINNQKDIFQSVPTLIKTFQYKSIVREPGEAEDLGLIQEPSNKKTSKFPPIEKCDFWKARLDLTYPEGLVQTSVFIKDAENPKNQPTKVDISSVTDLSSYLTWNSKVRMIVMVNKMWADKNPKDKVRKFGLAFKILSMEITPKEVSGGSIREAVMNYAFVNDCVEQETSGVTNDSELDNNVNEDTNGGTDAQDETQDETQETPDETQDETQDEEQDETQDEEQDETQDEEQDETQDEIQDETQDEEQDEVKEVVVEKKPVKKVDTKKPSKVVAPKATRGRK